MKTTTNPIESAIHLFEQYKTIGQKALQQLSDEEIVRIPAPESNSIYLIIKHLHGNMLSRWTDFLTTDGEKPWRNRDEEFEGAPLNREAIMQLWESGWTCLLDALNKLEENQLSTIVTIRHEPHSVLEAINRQIAHYAYHVGQIVFLAKLMKDRDWQTLSIAKGQSANFNKDKMK